MRLTLLGPHAGKNITISGFKFVEGVTEIPDDAGPARNILVNFHQAYPDAMLEEGEDGKLQLKATGPAESAVTVPHSNHTIGATVTAPAPAPVPEKVEGLSEDGGVAQPSGSAPPAGKQPKK